MSESIYHIYDKIFKKILTLSSTAVINLINGLFDTDYSSDNGVTYNWTEFVDGELRHILAGTILTVGTGNSYHLEAQMTEDDNIIFRVFEYGYRHADRGRENSHTGRRLLFPEARTIYLTSDSTTPDKYELTLDIGSHPLSAAEAEKAFRKGTLR